MIAAEKIDYALFCEDVALKLWGKPTESSDKELRWGTHGSRCLDLRTGRWFDHEANEGGSTIELLARDLRLDFKDALEWLRSEGLLGAPQPSAFEKLKGSKAHRRHLRLYGRVR